MSYFSSKLSQIIEDEYGSIVTLCKESGLDPSDVSRYLSDQRGISFAKLELLCDALDERSRADIVLAYLLDKIPPTAKHLVEARKLTKSSVREKRDEASIEYLPMEQKNAFKVLIEETIKYNDVAEAIIAMAKALRGANLTNTSTYSAHRSRRRDTALVPVYDSTDALSDKMPPSRHFEVPSALLNSHSQSNKLFILKADSDALKQENIVAGDHLIFDGKDKKGSVVAAQMEGRNAIAKVVEKNRKKYLQRGARSRLILAETCLIQGSLVALFRPGEHS